MTSIPWWREPTRAQWMTFIAAWLGWVLDAFDFIVFLLAMPHIAKEFGVSTTATAGSITLTLLIRLVGGLLAGSAADRWGRKLPLMISIAWFSLCDTAVYFAPSFGWILALRALFGLGMGAEWTAGATLAMENWPARSRGIASGILQGGYPVGFLLAALVSGYVIPHYGWRVLFLIAAAPLVVIFPVRFWVPESDEWKKTQQVQTRRGVGQFRQLWKPLLWACALMTTGFAINFSLTGVYSSMLANELQKTPQDTARLVALFNVGTLLGTALCGYVAAKRSVSLAIALGAMGVLPFLPLYAGLKPEWLLPGAFFTGAFGLGFAGIVPVLLHSIFPPEIRARGVGLVYHVGAVLGAFTPLGVAALGAKPGWSLREAICVFGGAAALTVLGLLKLQPEKREQELAISGDGASH